MAKVNPYKNVQMKVESSTLVIEIELENVEAMKSASGKSRLIATTGGNIPVPGHPSFRIGVNCYTKEA